MLSFLPTPLAMSAVAGTLALAAVVCLFLTKSVKLCAYLGAAAFVVGLCASVAYGYEKMGEDKIQPQLDACVADVKRSNAEAEEFRKASVTAVASVTAKFKGQVADLTKLNASLQEQIGAQAEEIRSIRIPAAVGSLLQPAIDAVNAGLPAIAGVGGNPAPAPAVPGDTDVAGWEGWSGQVVTLYGKCVKQVAGLQDYINQLVLASPKAK